MINNHNYNSPFANSLTATVNQDHNRATVGNDGSRADPVSSIPRNRPTRDQPSLKERAVRSLKIAMNELPNTIKTLFKKIVAIVKICTYVFLGLVLKFISFLIPLIESAREKLNESKGERVNQVGVNY